MFWKRTGQQDVASPKKKGPPFPTQQLFVLACARLCEPIAFASLFSYIYYMVASFKITNDDRQIAVYTGLITSVFTFAEFSSGVSWGKLSDVIGRKPVLMIGLSGTGLSMLIFGFARNIWVALFARALGGLLNGNIGVIQTTVAEVVKVKEHQPRAYSIMPFVWTIGAIIGASLGGALSDPVVNYPSVFSKGTIFETFPFLLPNLVCASVCIFSLLVGLLFLEETNDRAKHRRDIGLEVGQWLTRKLSSSKESTSRSTVPESRGVESDALIWEDVKPTGYGTGQASTERSTTVSGTTTPRVAASETDSTAPEHSVTKAFNRQVVLNIVSFGLVAYHTITFDQLLPVLLSMPESSAPISLPFQFMGGFALPTTTIGLIFSIQGVYNVVVQLVLFPFINHRIGSMRMFRYVTIAHPLVYFITPYLVLLRPDLRLVGLAAVIAGRVTCSSFAYTSLNILLANAAPSLLVLGTINGVAASIASLGRAVGPTLAGIVESAGLEIGCSGLAWWVSALVAVLGAVPLIWMEDPGFRADMLANEDEHIETVNETIVASQIAAGEPLLVDEAAFEENPNGEGSSRGDHTEASSSSSDR